MTKLVSARKNTATSIAITRFTHRDLCMLRRSAGPTIEFIAINEYDDKR